MSETKAIVFKLSLNSPKGRRIRVEEDTAWFKENIGFLRKEYSAGRVVVIEDRRFVCTGRSTQDAIESLFDMIGSHPSMFRLRDKDTIVVGHLESGTVDHVAIG